MMMMTMTKMMTMIMTTMTTIITAIVMMLMVLLMMIVMVRYSLQAPTKKVARLACGPPMLARKQHRMAPAADSIGGR